MDLFNGSVDKMKIIYLCTFDLKSEVAATKRMYLVAKALRLCGHEVSFIDASYCKRNKYIWHEFDVSSVVRENNIIGMIKTKVIAEDVLRQIRDQDVVIAYNYPCLPLSRINNYCKKNNIRIVADVADWPVPEGSFLHRLIMKYDIDIRMKKVNYKLDGLIVISDYLARYYSSSQKLVNVPPMVDLNETLQEVGSNSYARAELVLVTINTAGPEKEALDDLIDMFTAIKRRLLRPFLLYVVGMTEKQYNERYQKDIPNELKESIIFCGRLPHKETIKLIAKAAYFVFFRNRNQVTEAGFPTKFTEALSCGTPVLTTETSDLKKYLVQGENGFFIDNEDDLVEALSLDNYTINTMKNKSRNYKLFDYKEYTDCLDGFITNILNDSGDKR